MLEVYYSPKTGRSRSWLRSWLKTLAEMISTFALASGTQHHASHTFRKLAVAHHLRDVLASDEHIQVTVNRMTGGKSTLTLLMPFYTIWSTNILTVL